MELTLKLDGCEARQLMNTLKADRKFWQEKANEKARKILGSDTEKTLGFYSEYIAPINRVILKLEKAFKTDCDFNV